MTATNGVPSEAPSVVRRLETPAASSLARLAEVFDDLQMVLRCCERLVSELARGDAETDDVVVEAVWTTALLSYARCFSAGEEGGSLVEKDVESTQSSAKALEWHHVLLRLREHYVDPSANPRERFSVGVAQDESGAAGGVAITSAHQPLVDDLTVRQTGAIAFALSRLVNERIDAGQEKVFTEVKEMSPADLESLVRLDVADRSGRS